MRIIVKIIVMSVLFIMLVAASYFLYVAISGLRAEPVEFVKTEQVREQPSYSGQLQFYPNMRFSKKEMSYRIASSCSEEKIKRMRQALTKLEEEAGILKFFYAKSKETDILVECDEKKEPKVSREYFVAGEGGATSIINTSLFYIIEKGKVLLFYSKDRCKNYNVELHELLHVFGFKHSTNKNSIMYNITQCKQEITNDIIEELKRLYSILELPDLYFSDISAEKHGIYLDFSVKVKNQGLAKSEQAVLELYANKKIEEFELGKINYGEGKYLEAKNIKLPSRGIKELKFIITAGEEIDKENNAVELVLVS